MSEGCQQLSTALLVAQQGCGMHLAVKRLVAGVPVASWVSRTGFGGVLRALAVGPIVSELMLMVASGAQ